MHVIATCFKVANRHDVLFQCEGAEHILDEA